MDQALCIKKIRWDNFEEAENREYEKILELLKIKAGCVDGYCRPNRSKRNGWTKRNLLRVG
jgi:hypothetical protein